MKKLLPCLFLFVSVGVLGADMFTVPGVPYVKAAQIFSDFDK